MNMHEVGGHITFIVSCICYGLKSMKR